MRFKIPVGIVSAIALLCVSYYSPQDNVKIAGASPNGGEKVPSCTDNYGSWYSSTTRKTSADWDITFIPYSYDQNDYKTEMNQFTDLNGDGLVDFLHVFRPSLVSSVLPRGYCVALNNGSGWDVVYKCVHKGYSTITYYGDCAA